MRLRDTSLTCGCVRLHNYRAAHNAVGRANSRRSFLTSSSQIISASQSLPHSRQELYPIIADISSYPLFLPYCTTAKILDWSRLDQTQRRWPARALLGVGFGAIHEQYVSRVYCIPERTVEALAGEARTGLGLDELRELYGGVSNVPDVQDGGGSLFRSLRSTWSLHSEDSSIQHPSTRVDLKIEFDFQSPIYAAMAGAAIPRVAQTVMDAFRSRAKAVIEGTT